MFVLSKIYIENKTKIILDTTLSDQKHRNYRSDNFISLIIGENGVGKSFLLKSLVDIFIYLEKIDSYKRKPKYRYEKFYIEYYFNGNTYSVRRNSGSEIFYSKKFYRASIITFKSYSLFFYGFINLRTDFVGFG